MKDRRFAPAKPRPPVRAPLADTILGRRDVAIVPWIAICIGSLAVAASTALRAPWPEVDQLVLASAIGVSAFTGVMAAVQDTALGVRFRGSLWVYLLSIAALFALLTALALRDHGLATVYWSACVLLAAYAGLVFPVKWSRRSLAVMVLTACTVQAIRPDASAIEAIVSIGMVATGWAVGFLGQSGHHRAAQGARHLSSFDQLTALLNRRGFVAQLAMHVGRRAANAADEEEIALLIVDLDGFKTINDEQGHGAGDEILAWVGRTIPTVLPTSAEVGRLGGDEFAILLTGVSAERATVIAHATRDALSERIGASIGIATSATRAVVADDLLRVADAALYMCKRDRSLGVQGLVAGSSADAIAVDQPADSGPSPLSFARIRTSGRSPEPDPPGVIYGWLFATGSSVIAIAGAVIVAAALIDRPDNIWGLVLNVLGVPWVIWNLWLARFSLRQRIHRETDRTFVPLLVGCAWPLAGGLAVAMLAAGGLTAPIAAALFLKTLFDAAVSPTKYARLTLLLMFAGWAFAAAFSPVSTLWTAPFHLAIFGAAYAIGAIAHRAFQDVTTESLLLARTDVLTKVNNRLGFEEQARAVLIAARAQGAPFGLLALDLDDFKSVNDTLGHAAGDELLQRVAALITEAIPDSQAIGRLGGDEFVVLVPTGEDDAVVARARSLAATLRTVVGASVGHAVFPRDGEDLDALLGAADQRSYEEKRSRKGAANAPAPGGPLEITR